MPPIEPVLVVAILMLVAVLAGKVSGRFGIPAILLFLAIGMLAGSDGPGGIEFEDAGVASSIGAVALAYILFSGGLDTRWPAVRPVLRPGILLATAGTLITAFVAGLGAWLLFGTSLTVGLLMGAIISSTDAAAVFSVLRSRGVNLKGRLRPLLEFESGSNDPMAVFLTIGLTTLLTQPGVSTGDLILLFVKQMTLGAIVGVLLAAGAAWVINHIRLEYEGLYPVFTVALVIFIYSLTAWMGGSGFLAVYLAGLTMGRRRLVHKRSLMRFHDGIGWLMQIVMFLILGLLVFPSELPAVILPGLGLTAVLMLVARPLAVFSTLRPSRWTGRERTFISWVGLRGAVPIVLATFPLAERVERADLIFDAVFFVVLVSVLLQGTTIPTAAQRLGVASNEPTSPDHEETVGGAATERGLSEIVVNVDAWVVGRQVVEIDLPGSAWLTLLTRDEEVIVPQGHTVLHEGDVLTVLASPPEAAEIRRLCG
ncbi:MAG: potassium/proton antiporter [Acidimicrobiia bacterium]